MPLSGRPRVLWKRTVTRWSRQCGDGSATAMPGKARRNHLRRHSATGPKRRSWDSSRYCIAIH